MIFIYFIHFIILFFHFIIIYILSQVYIINIIIHILLYHYLFILIRLSLKGHQLFLIFLCVLNQIFLYHNLHNLFLYNLHHLIQIHLWIIQNKIFITQISCRSRKTNLIVLSQLICLFFFSIFY